jgi:hypothetical protein
MQALPYYPYSSPVTPLYVILLKCGSRHMDSGALDEDLEETSIYIIYLLSAFGAYMLSI